VVSAAAVVAATALAAGLMAVGLTEAEVATAEDMATLVVPVGLRPGGKVAGVHLRNDMSISLRHGFSFLLRHCTSKSGRLL